MLLLSPPSVLMTTLLEKAVELGFIKGFAWDSTLTFVSTVRGSRRYPSKFKPDAGSKEKTPLLAFNRMSSVAQIPFRQFPKVYHPSANGYDVNMFDFVPIRIPLVFKCFFTDIVQAEKFELEYSLLLGVNSIVKITVPPIPNVLSEEMEFDVCWDTMEDLEISNEGNSFISISFKADVFGASLRYADEKEYIIKQIETYVRNLQDSALFLEMVFPDPWYPLPIEGNLQEPQPVTSMVVNSEGVPFIVQRLNSSPLSMVQSLDSNGEWVSLLSLADSFNDLRMTSTGGVYLGSSAGIFLKSTNTWEQLLDPALNVIHLEITNEDKLVFIVQDAPEVMLLEGTVSTLFSVEFPLLISCDKLSESILCSGSFTESGIIQIPSGVLLFKDSQVVPLNFPDSMGSSAVAIQVYDGDSYVLTAEALFKVDQENTFSQVGSFNFKNDLNVVMEAQSLLVDETGVYVFVKGGALKEFSYLLRWDGSFWTSVGEFTGGFQGEGVVGDSSINQIIRGADEFIYVCGFLSKVNDVEITHLAKRTFPMFALPIPEES